MLVRLLVLWLSACAMPCFAGYASTVQGSVSADTVYLTGGTASELCAKFDRLRFRADWYTHERGFFVYVPAASSGPDQCVGYAEADRAQVWLDFDVMDCEQPNAVNPAWTCATSDVPSVGTDSGVTEFVVAGPSLGGSGGGDMSLGWLTDLSPEQGGQIAGAILAIWAFGWGIRVLIKTLNTVDGETQSERE